MNKFTKTINYLQKAVTIIEKARQEILGKHSEDNAPQDLFTELNVYEDIGNIVGDIQDAVINVEHLEIKKRSYRHMK